MIEFSTIWRSAIYGKCVSLAVLIFVLQVKIKLGHYDCETLLNEVLTEFPPESLLQRPGLLEGVLNIVATMFGRGYHGTPLPAA
jgi:hypothetical protein